MTATALPWLLIGPGGCVEAGDGSAPGGESRTNPFLGDGRVADFQLSEEFELDLTGDGYPELVLVSVHGEHPRALEIDLTVYRGDDALYASSWSSADYPEFQRAGSEEAPAWVASQVVRSRLEDLLGDDALGPLAEEDIDPAVVRWELQLEEWRRERGSPASVPLTDEERAEVAGVAVPGDRVEEILESLPGRPALGYLAGDSWRIIVWSPELARFLTVASCC